MLTLIALIIFGGSFIGLIILFFKKIPVLVVLSEQELKEQLIESPIKQNILQKTNLIKQAVLHNAKMQVVMTKTTSKFKTIFASGRATIEDLEKIEKIHKEGDYWQKVEEHKLPSFSIKKLYGVTDSKKQTSKKPKAKTIKIKTSIEAEQENIPVKLKRTRKPKKPKNPKAE